MTHNWLEDPVPDGVIQRVHALARDLAYGAANGLWTSEVQVMRPGESTIWLVSGRKDTKLHDKWIDAFPSPSLLLSLRYFDMLREVQSGNVVYLLTDQAFALLEQPIPTSIFISYRRSKSSAFALLILARFKALGLEPFLDMSIEPGDDWHAQLEREVSEREHFISLIGPDTLESEYVRREIEWALAAGATIIPIWHNGFDGVQWEAFRKTYPALAAFFKANAIQVEKENPIGYEGAIIQLLNRFGVTPS